MTHDSRAPRGQRGDCNRQDILPLWRSVPHAVRPGQGKPSYMRISVGARGSRGSPVNAQILSYPEGRNVPEPTKKSYCPIVFGFGAERHVFSDRIRPRWQACTFSVPLRAFHLYTCTHCSRETMLAIAEETGDAELRHGSAVGGIENSWRRDSATMPLERGQEVSSVDHQDQGKQVTGFVASLEVEERVAAPQVGVLAAVAPGLGTGNTEL